MPVLLKIFRSKTSGQNLFKFCQTILYCTLFYLFFSSIILNDHFLVSHLLNSFFVYVCMLRIYI